MIDQKKCYVGVDLGGTKVEVALVAEDGRIEARKKIPTDVKGGPDSIVKDIAEIVRQLTQETSARPEKVGIGIAGQIDPETGVVGFAPNLGWKNFSLQETLSRLLQLPVAVTNDVHAAAWGEWLFGAGRGSRDMVCIFVGTGIGSGIVADGKMLKGATNCAGEIGHTIVSLQGPDCHCGSFGCLEALAGGWAIARRAREAIQADPREGRALLKNAEGNLEAVTARIVCQTANDGDPFAALLVDEVVRALIAGVVNIVHTLNPERVILGGGIIEGNPSLIARIVEGVHKRALKSATVSLKIVKADLKGNAGVIGAAAYARSR